MLRQNGASPPPCALRCDVRCIVSGQVTVAFIRRKNYKRRPGHGGDDIVSILIDTIELTILYNSALYYSYCSPIGSDIPDEEYNVT